MRYRPKWRNPTGIFLILLLIAVWSVLVATGSTYLAGLPWPVHLIYYLVAGIVWILPLKPLLRWMETGHLRGRDRARDRTSQ